jgi:hypothetical protein
MAGETANARGFFWDIIPANKKAHTGYGEGRAEI